MAYPPGVSARTPNAPWNEPDAPECPECGVRIIKQADHEAGCDFNGTPEEVAEHWAEQARDAYTEVN